MKLSPRSGVSAERRWLLFPRIAALCQDAATPGFMVPMHAKTASGLSINRIAQGLRPQRPRTLNSVAADVRRLILFRMKEIGASLRRLLRFMVAIHVRILEVPPAP